MKRFSRIFICLFVLFLSSAPLKALNSVNWLARGGMLFITEDNDVASDPSPVLFSPGAAVRLSFLDFIALEISLDFYGTNYAYSYSLDRAVPAAIENRSAFVFGTVLGVQAVYSFKPFDFWTIRVYGGPGIDMRFCLTASGLEGADKEDAAKQTKDVSSYFWGMGRWFYPVAGVGMDFVATEKLLLGFDFRTWFPVYKLWDGVDLPGLEGWRFGLGFTITFR